MSNSSYCYTVMHKEVFSMFCQSNIGMHFLSPGDWKGRKCYACWLINRIWAMVESSTKRQMGSLRSDFALNARESSLPYSLVYEMVPYAKARPRRATLTWRRPKEGGTRRKSPQEAESSRGGKDETTVANLKTRSLRRVAQMVARSLGSLFL